MRARLVDSESNKLISGGLELVSDWQDQKSSTIGLHIEGAITTGTRIRAPRMSLNGVS